MNEAPRNILSLPLLLLQQLLRKGQLICTRSGVCWHTLTGVSYFCLGSFSATHLPTAALTPVLQILLQTQLGSCHSLAQPINTWSLSIKYNFLTITSTHLYLVGHPVTHTVFWLHTIRYHLSVLLPPHTPPIPLPHFCSSPEPVWNALSPSLHFRFLVTVRPMMKFDVSSGQQIFKEFLGSYQTLW